MPDFINKPKLEDCSINTLIRHIPNIINNNNQEINRTFNDIFEFGDEKNKTQYIKVPLITKGIVKGNTGYFNNLRITDQIIFDTSANLQEYIIVDHQKSLNRFKNNYEEENIKNTYTHDADTIFYKDGPISNLLSNLSDSLNNIDNITTSISNLDTSVKELYLMINDIANKLNINNEYKKEEIESIADDNLIQALNSSTNSYTYSSDVYKK